MEKIVFLSLVSLTHEQKELSAATLYVCFSGANCVIIESEKEEAFTHLTILLYIHYFN